MSAKPAITDIAVTAINDRTCYVSWRTRDARYHFHLYDNATSYTNETLFKNSLANHGEAGYFATRRLDGTKASNSYMIACAMDTVKRGDMITIARVAKHVADAKERNEQDAFTSRREQARIIFAAMRDTINSTRQLYTLNRIDIDALLSYAPNETE